MDPGVASHSKRVMDIPRMRCIVIIAALQVLVFAVLWWCSGCSVLPYEPLRVRGDLLHTLSTGSLEDVKLDSYSTKKLVRLARLKTGCKSIWSRSPAYTICIDVDDEAVRPFYTTREQSAGTGFTERIEPVVRWLRHWKPIATQTVILKYSDGFTPADFAWFSKLPPQIFVFAFCAPCALRGTNIITIPDFEFLRERYNMDFGPTVDEYSSVSPIRAKIPGVIFRGSVRGDRPFYVANHTSLRGRYMDWHHMLQYRGIVDLDGNTNSWRGAYWKLRSNSVVLKQHSPWCQWYYNRLVPYIHYIPLARDLHDLDKWKMWLADDQHLPKMKAIATASTELMQTLTLSSALTQLKYDVIRGASRPVTSEILSAMNETMSEVIRPNIFP